MTCIYRKNSVIGPDDSDDICVFANSDKKILSFFKGVAGKEKIRVPLVRHFLLFS